MEVKVTGIMDSEVSNEKFSKSSGFSALVKTKHQTILFNTGKDAEAFATNISLLEPNLKKLDFLFISHDHPEHTGALEYVLEHYIIGHVVIPNLQDKTLYKRTKKLGHTPMEIREATTLDYEIHSTGGIGKEVTEQSLIISTTKGLVIITGCSYYGLEQLVRGIEKKFKYEIHMIIGGFTLYNSYERMTQENFNLLKEKHPNLLLAPSNCTERYVRETLEKKLAEKFLDFKTGIIVEV